MITRTIILSVFIFLQLCYAQASEEQTPQYTFFKANSFYEESQYDKAIDAYNKLIEQGVESGNLYYNLGNCFFKKGELGMAIVNFEKARRLIPRDSDLESNYEHAKSKIKNNVATPKKVWIFRMLDNFSGQFTLDSVTLFLSCLWMLTIVILMVNMFYSRLRRYSIFFILLILMFFVLGAISFRTKVKGLDTEAIMITEETDAKFEPFDRATTFFQVYEGMKVNVVDTKGNWYKVKRLDGKVGWIKKVSVEII